MNMLSMGKEIKNCLDGWIYLVVQKVFLQDLNLTLYFYTLQSTRVNQHYLSTNLLSTVLEMRQKNIVSYKVKVYKKCFKNIFLKIPFPLSKDVI